MNNTSKCVYTIANLYKIHDEPHETLGTEIRLLTTETLDNIIKSNQAGKIEQLHLDKWNSKKVDKWGNIEEV
jgi:hypothetical protein